jgi:hypothetical protein
MLLYKGLSQNQPVRASARWSWRFCLFSLYIIAVAFLLRFWNKISFEGALWAIGLAGLMAIIALFWSFYAFQRLWFEGGRGGTKAAFAMVGSLVVLIPLCFQLSYIFIEDHFISESISGHIFSLAVEAKPVSQSSAFTHNEKFRRPLWQVYDIVEKSLHLNDMTLTHKERDDLTQSATLSARFEGPWLKPPYDVNIVLRDDGYYTMVTLKAEPLFSAIYDFGLLEKTMLDLLETIDVTIEATPRPKADL